MTEKPIKTKKTPKNQRQDHAAIFIRLSVAEKAAIDAAVAKAGFRSISEWLRVTKLREELLLANA